MNKSRQNLPKYLLALVVIITFIAIYYLNCIYPIILDDWEYSFMYFGTERIGSIMEAFTSQYVHYFKWGGRSVVHTILQILLYWGPFWSDLLNAVAFVAFIGIIYKIANKWNNTRPSLFIAIILLIWFFQPDMGETTLWLTGSVNYLWGTLFILAFIYPFYSYFRESQINHLERACKNNIIYIIFIFFCGMIAGWTNENTAASMLLLITIFLLMIWQKNKAIEKWAISGYIGACIGFAFMFLAPGNYARYRIEIQQLGLAERPGIDFYLERLQVLLTDFSKYGLILMAIYSIILIVFMLTAAQSTRRTILISSLLFLLAGATSALAMIASPVFFPRTWFGIFSFIIVATAILYANIDFSKPLVKYTNLVCLCLALGFFAKTFFDGTTELIRLREISDKREKELYEQKAQGKEHIVLHGGKFEKREDLIIPKMYDFPQDTTMWMYKAYVRYHDVKSMRIEE